MAPLVVMAVAWTVARGIAYASSWQVADSSTGALRLALAAMFLFTAVSHFHPRTRSDLIRMVPITLPSPSFLVTVTGVFELIGAIGLLVPATAAAASYALMTLLAAMFPANVHAARERSVVAGRRASPLMWRLPLQLFWIVTLWCVARASAGA